MSDLHSASAGPLGDEVRSDCRVAYEPGEGPLAVEVVSKVDYLYGQSIAAALRRVAGGLGVGTGRLSIVDRGAVEWVILARAEACLRLAGAVGPAVLPEAHPSCGVPRSRERLRRSRLYVPGNQPKLMLSAGLYGADAIILDLEDSVPPAEKASALLLVRNALIALDWGASERMVRVNQGELGLEELRRIGPHNPHTVLLPKVEHPDAVHRAAAVLAELGLADRPFLMPILESPLGIHRAFEIAAADPTVVALTLGLEDLSAELGAPRTEEGVESLLARQTTVYAARAAGVQPIASVYSGIADETGLEAYVRRERGLGFVGVGCIHPRQIAVVHRAMTPSEREVERAIAIVRAARDAEARGLGAVAVGSKMVDPPVVRQAFRTVELAVAGGALAAGWDDAES
ncbi:MAG: aldolase/citrate lyase family protein [Thermoanaerobaculales bacterium]|jgi:citrate lyase subunit beta/citryl-CoA lyase|nr:aldolase/citrate lyase family protein [Thermoanaerobaculales bacterium]